MSPASRPSSQSTPILPLPHRIRGNGRVHLRGAGEVVVTLAGEGQVTVLLRPDTQVRFAGVGFRRMPSSHEIVYVSARGTLHLEGSGVDVRFGAARPVAVDVSCAGTFEATLDGVGEVASPSGARIGWGLHPKALRLAGADAVEIPLPPHDSHPERGAA
jgi:hypothetical protein